MKNNYFYDLPDELQAEIYKKVFNNVIKELTSIINIPFIECKIIDKKYEMFQVVDLTIFQSLLVKQNSFLYKLSVKDALCFEKVFKILCVYNHLEIFEAYGLPKKKYWYSYRYGNFNIDINYTYTNKYDLYKMIYNYYYGQTKNDIFEYLNYENKQGSVYYSWTKKKMIKYCMKM